ncbi:hypothetical protein AUP68_10130 [Ilyonectria robusta]
MTSYKWQPDNTYGGISNPSYSVISYTWGRWRLAENSCTDSLPVRGVPWQVPKVDPKHFTIKRFQRVLDIIVNREDKFDAAAPFVWLDVACIPQWKHSTIADSEVGRQARIFRGAIKGYMWLTTADPATLAMLFSKELHDKTRDPISDLQSFCHLLEDPWFWFMWTLQESFIQGDAYIIAGSDFCFMTGHKRPLNIYQIRGLAMHYTGDVSYTPRYDHRKIEVELSKFADMWRRSGLQGPLSASPMQVLACAFFRTSEHVLDRVYGIMQIFGDEFRVGKASEGGGPKQTFTLEELEDALGVLVVNRFPTISQLFYHEETPLAGRAWRICGRASVPRPLAYESAQFNDKLSTPGSRRETSRFYLKITTDHLDATTWGKFEGKVCPLTTITNCLKSPSFAPEWSTMECYFDAGAGVPAHAGNKGQRVYSLQDIQPVTDHFGPIELMAVLLSIRVDLEVGKTCKVNGLLILRPGKAALEVHRNRRGWYSGLDGVGILAWARVGVFQLEWYEERDKVTFKYMKDQVKTLFGVSEHWGDADGIWG